MYPILNENQIFFNWIRTWRNRLELFIKNMFILNSLACLDFSFWASQKRVRFLAFSGFQTSGFWYPTVTIERNGNAPSSKDFANITFCSPISILTTNNIGKYTSKKSGNKVENRETNYVANPRGEIKVLFGWSHC